MRRPIAFLVLLLAVLLAAPAWPASATDEPPQLHREGRWLVDPQGRRVIVHGVNLVYKRPPYAPPASAAGFTSRDADFLRRHGFNGARIGMLWAGVTPDEPGVADPAYFRTWDRVLGMLSKRGIWMMLDGHQDMWHETYGGEGAPDWAVRRPAPYHLLPPVNLPFPQGYWTPEVSTVFDRFWANKDGLLDGWAAYWQRVAERYRDQPHLMGYDLMNEPWAGMEWQTCLLLGCRGTYARELQPAYTKGLRAVRRADPRNIVWWEAQQFTAGQKLDSYYTPVAGERNLGFSFHNYCPDVFFESQGIPGGNVENCVGFTDDRNAHGLEQARQMRAVPFLSEFGATDNTRAIGIDAAGADRAKMSWTYWAYKHWNDPTTADGAQGLFRDDADLSTVKREKLRELVRTYPQATAGTPRRFSYDPDTGRFTFRYQPDETRAPTRIFVSPIGAPNYRVSVTNGRVSKQRGRYVDLQPEDRSRPVDVLITRR